MTKQAQASFPLTPLAIGVHGPFTSGLLPSTLAGYVVDLLNDASWPADGDVCTITVEQSNDSGITWAFDASITLAGGLWKTKAGVPVNAAPWAVSINNSGSTTRKVRATVAAIQACTLGATLSSV
jgi:hypothetical protein